VAQVRAAGANPIVIDGGDTLFKGDVLNPSREGDPETSARLILDVMDAVGTDAFVPGPRDFAAGVDFLVKETQQRKTPVVSANLVNRQTGKPLFRRTVIVERGGLKIGVLGVISAKLKETLGAGGAAIDVLDPVQEARAAARELRGQTDIVLAVLALTSAEMAQVAKAATDIDVLLLSHDQREVFRPTQVKEGKPAVAVASRGKAVGDLRLFFREKGRPFADASKRQTIEGRMARIERQIEARTSGETIDAEAKARRAELVRSLKQQLEAAREELRQFEKSPNGVKFTTVNLGQEIADDAAIRRRVDEIAPRDEAEGRGAPRVGDETLPAIDDLTPGDELAPMPFFRGRRQDAAEPSPTAPAPRRPGEAKTK
jgi:2',3'-cyclic-nucleotide 2'-phosphodiesterase (5'-nucleotidase family)